MVIGPAVRPILLLLIGVLPLASQSDKARLPKKGDTVLIKGCLRGSAVEAAELMTVDAEDSRHYVEGVPALTYRLHGEKKLLKTLKDKADRMIVEIKGVLKSELSHSGLGTSIGRTRITIGVDPRSRNAAQPMPVLEALSYESSTVRCGR